MTGSLERGSSFEERVSLDPVEPEGAMQPPLGLSASVAKRSSHKMRPLSSSRSQSLRRASSFADRMTVEVDTDASQSLRRGSSFEDRMTLEVHEDVPQHVHDARPEPESEMSSLGTQRSSSKRGAAAAAASCERSSFVRQKLRKGSSFAQRLDIEAGTTMESEDGMSSGGGCSATVAEQGLSPGPNSLADMLRWPERFLDSIGSLEARALAHRLRSGVSIRSAYTGIGAAELALQMIQEAIINEGLAEDEESFRGMRVASQVEKDATCQKVLLTHVGTASEPLHLFTDILESIPEVLRSGLQQLEETIATRCWEERQAGTKTDGPEWMQNLSEHYHQQVSDLFKVWNHKFREDACTSHCLIHSGLCPCWSASDHEDGRVTVAVAGSTCVDFSRYGQNKKFCGASALPFWTWLRQRSDLLEDMWVHENVPSFPSSMISRHLQHAYHIFTISRCPSEIGQPSTGRRSFVLGIRKDTWKVKEIFGQASFSVFARSMTVTPAVFFVTQVDEQATASGPSSGQEWRPDPAATAYIPKSNERSR